MSAPAEKAKHIRLLILDADGVLTNGIVYYDRNGVETKGFYMPDGLGIKLMQKANIPVAIITAKNSGSVAHRAAELGIIHLYLGHENKLPAYDDLKQKLQIDDQQIAYIGDDLPDLVLLRRVGLAITVPHAPDILKKNVDLVTTREGGKGAIREACEFILQAQSKYETVIESFIIQ
jgi:3-deoxy-D-manno-octulosonate 8-phosphate phosphatase (KDO 8-P phosphatase)